MKYADLTKNVFAVFDLPAWEALGIATFPSNYTAVGSTYIRVSVVPSGKGVNRASSSGIVKIDIFVELGIGPKSISDIADSLDTFLENKSIKLNSCVTQFFSSSLSERGSEKDSSLYRAVYEIPFKHFNEV